MSQESSRVLILAEMLGLLAGGFYAARGDGSEPWIHQLVTKPGLGRTVAVSVLAAVLLLLADIGLGGPAALFGAVVLFGFLASHGVGLGDKLLDLERRVFHP